MVMETRTKNNLYDLVIGIKLSGPGSTVFCLADIHEYNCSIAVTIGVEYDWCRILYDSNNVDVVDL